MADVTIIVGGGALLQTLQRVEAKLDALLSQETKMSQELDDLKAQVQQVTSVTQSVVTLVTGLADRIAANKNDPAALQALHDELKGDAATLGKLVSDNTPAGAGGGGGTPAPAPAGGAAKAP